MSTVFLRFCFLMLYCVVWLGCCLVNLTINIMSWFLTVRNMFLMYWKGKHLFSLCFTLVVLLHSLRMHFTHIINECYTIITTMHLT